MQHITRCRRTQQPCLQTTSTRPNTLLHAVASRSSMHAPRRKQCCTSRAADSCLQPTPTKAGTLHRATVSHLQCMHRGKRAAHHLLQDLKLPTATWTPLVSIGAPAQSSSQVAASCHVCTGFSVCCKCDIAQCDMKQSDVTQVDATQCDDTSVKALQV